MQRFADWLKREVKGRPHFIADNNGFDWSFINWYFHHFLGDNPFGYSSTNLGSLYKGVVQDMFQNFKHLRKTAHDHHPVNDAKGECRSVAHIRASVWLEITLETAITRNASANRPDSPCRVLNHDLCPKIMFIRMSNAHFHEFTNRQFHPFDHHLPVNFRRVTVTAARLLPIFRIVNENRQGFTNHPTEFRSTDLCLYFHETL